MDKDNNFSIYNLIAICSICFWMAACTRTKPEGAGTDWATYLGHPTSNQYSTLDQVNIDNVAQLELAWARDLAKGDNKG